MSVSNVKSNLATGLLVGGLVLASLLNVLFCNLFKLPLHQATHKPMPTATESESAIFQMLTNILILQFLLTPIPIGFAYYLSEDPGLVEIIGYFIGSLLFGVMLVFILLFLASASKKVFSILIIDPNNL